MLLSRLKYLTALAKERHFARAAQACHVSQPALSSAIRKLEVEFRVPIVKRSNRFIGFTHEGEQIVTWAQRVIAEHDTLLESVRNGREGLSGRLRIGAIPTTLSSLSLITRGLCDLHPQVTLSIVSMTSTEIEQALADFQIDVGVTYIDNEPLDHVRRRHLYREHYVLLTAEDGPLGHRASISWAEAAEVPLCLLTPDMQNRRIIDGAFRRAGARPVPRVETNSVSALCSHVRGSQWSAVMPHAWLYLHAIPEGMRAIPLVQPEIGQEIGLVVADRDPEPVLARALFDSVAGVDLEEHLARRDPAGGTALTG